MKTKQSAEPIYYQIDKQTEQITIVTELPNNSISTEQHWYCAINSNVFNTEEERVKHIRGLDIWFKNMNNEN